MRPKPSRSSGIGKNRYRGQRAAAFGRYFQYPVALESSLIVPRTQSGGWRPKPAIYDTPTKTPPNR